MSCDVGEVTERLENEQSSCVKLYILQSVWRVKRIFPRKYLKGVGGGEFVVSLNATAGIGRVVNTFLVRAQRRIELYS